MAALATLMQINPAWQALLESTEWENYGAGRNPKCANCMAHCGFEGTAASNVIRNSLRLQQAIGKLTIYEFRLSP
ncbi:MAG TPA: DUF3463 domain-containing protein [Gammaproteobacteria bacterium]|nr:DUF3463 domain-containing protein [Gammaproteobacteria bacterium]